MENNEAHLAQNALLKQQNKLLTKLLNGQSRHTSLLTQVAQALQEREPGYRRTLSAYAHFDWQTIGANVLERDQGAPTKLGWGGHEWLRRTKDDPKYGKAVWYSRHVSGSGENVKYYTLVKFVDDDKMAVSSMPSSMPQQPPSKPPTKDWRADAISSLDAFMFDTAYQRYQCKYFKKSGDVTSARLAICGEWVAEGGAYATAVCDALDFYVSEITAMKVRKQNNPAITINGSAIIEQAQSKFKERANVHGG